MNYGEIISLGRHKLMCGDATRLEDVHALVGDDTVNLVLTDPPYGKCQVGNYNFKGTFGKTLNPANRYVKIIGNESVKTARENYEIIKSLTDNLIIWGGIYFTEFLPVSKCWLVWQKNQTLYNHSACELAYTTFRKNIKLYEQTWSGACRAGSQKLNPRPCVHPTQKPVELHMKILEDFTQEGDCILDCFGGSGTTLIACEITGRKCLMMEISPEYCEIIRKRYDDLIPEIFREEVR